MPKPLLLLTSWNVYESIDDIERFIQEAVQKQTEQMQYGLALPYLALKEVSHRHTYPHVLFGALHMNSVDQGAFTQSIAAKMLKMAGASFVLIGSDYERHVLREAGASFHRKIVEALKEGVTPIVCVGETAEEHLAGNGEAIIEAQLREAFLDIPAEQIENVGVFFEAPWMKQLVYKPTVEEVTRSYDRDHAILAQIVGSKAAENMQVIHTAPEDFTGFHPPANKGVFTFQHNVNKVYEHAVALQARKDAELAEAQLLETTREAEAVLDEAAPMASDEDILANDEVVGGISEEAAEALEVEQALIEAAEAVKPADEKASLLPTQAESEQAPPDESADAVEVEQALIETAGTVKSAKEKEFSLSTEAASEIAGLDESADAPEIEQVPIETADTPEPIPSAGVGISSGDLPLDGPDVSIPDDLPVASPPAPTPARSAPAQVVPPAPKTGKVRKDHKVSDIN